MARNFQVDVVATPRLDLCGAAAQDLKYRENNGKYPMESRSKMAKEQEKLNKFLRYVNESFIIKGFSKNSAAGQSGVKGFASGNSAPELVRDKEVTLGSFEISHDDRAQILVLFSVSGDAASSTAEPAVLTVRILENNSAVASFKQAVNGFVTVSAPFLLINREAGVSSVQVAASVSGGEVYVEKYGAFASALMIE